MKKYVIFAIAIGILALISGSIATGPIKQEQHKNPGISISGTVETIKNFAKTSQPAGGGTCTDGTDLGGGNIRINCDSTKSPHNEMAISVDPSDPNHIVAGSNDYVFSFNGAVIVLKTIAGGYYTSFDGGATWINGLTSNGKFAYAGDPSVAFNKKFGLVHYGVAAFQSTGSALSVQISTSTDGGKTFGKPVIVALGSGFTIANDKPYITVDNNPGSSHYGRLYVTWTQFISDQSGNYIKSPIMLSFSNDGGKTFSTPEEISGNSANLCAYPAVSSNTGICNEDQFSSPVVGTDGTLYVAFENEQGDSTQGEFRDQYLIVNSTDEVNWNGPYQAVATIYDGTNDYPINVDGRQNLSNSQFRVNSAGNLAVDPSTNQLYIAFSDNRKRTASSTNTTVFVTTSTDGGLTWSSSVQVPKGGLSNPADAFFPWAAVNSGVLKVAFSDRSYDSNNVKYGETLAKSTDNGAMFSSSEVDTGLSNPDDSFWFSDGTGKATFIGDYNGLDIGSDGISHPIWTDMRMTAFSNPPPGYGHKTQDAVTARS